MDLIEEPAGEFTHASHRQSLAVIWARYQYYLATGDEEELQKMREDLQALHSLIFTTEYVLQTNRYNCALMKDLITSDVLTPGEKTMARNICIMGQFEYFPEGDIAYDLHDYHPGLDYASNELDYLSDEITLVTNKEREIAPAERIDFDAQALIGEITADLEDFADDGQINVVGEGTESYFSRRFLTRELVAALDRIAAADINSDEVSQINSEDDILDYLILTRETLRWYGSLDPDYFNMFENDTCLLRANINYFIDHYASNMSVRTRELIDRKLTSVEDYNTFSPTCAYANHLLGDTVDKDIIMQDIAYINNRTSATDWDAGYLISDGDNLYIYPVLINAMTAGLLSL